MKLIFAILPDEDTENVSQSLITSGFRVTRIASTGGFWRRGNTTLMIGVEDDKVDEAIKIMKGIRAEAADPGQHYVTLFVLNVAHYDHL